ncbi:MAG: FkbM family methyltransferase [Propylenella sp.]
MQEEVSNGPGVPAFLIKRHLPDFCPKVIVDVGANAGASALAFANAFPEAQIYAFEPVASVFRTLAANFESEPRVRTVNAALGRRSGRAHVTKRPASASNRIVESPNLFERRQTEKVTMTSGDEFCVEHGIERIGFLKVDAEGHDLDVLIGFQRMLAAHTIDLLETEVGMNRDNRRHVPFEAVKAYLDPLGYSLFHIHDLAMDTPFSGRVVLRRVNAMFVSDAFADANRAELEKSSAR